MEIFIFFGPPGVGKGTQAKKFALKHGLKHISTGDLLRQEVAKNTELGRAVKQYIDQGSLVPDLMVIKIVEEQIKDGVDTPGFVFDGFPRTLEQAKALDEMITANRQKIRQVISLEVDEEETTKRLLFRAKLEGRSDDTKEAIQNRFNIYHALTEPILDYYHLQRKLETVDGTGTIEEVEVKIDAVAEI